MAMVFERVQTEGIAQLSYLIGDDSAGVAAVIDPRPGADVYLELARKHRVGITHVFETHIHADFVSGAGGLLHRLGNAKLCVSGEDGATCVRRFESAQEVALRAASWTDFCIDSRNVRSPTA